MVNKIGFMQGRLVKSEKPKLIQSFPWKNWKKEFYLADKNKIRILEWTIDYEKFNQNPLINKKSLPIIKKLKKKYNININSVTCDFYMQKPYIKAKTKKLKNNIRNNFISLISSCKLMKIKYIVVPLVDNSKLSSSSEEKKTIEFFLSFREILRKTGINILFEIDYEPKKLLRFINKFDNYYGINYDSGNSASLGYDLKNEKIYFNRVRNVHIKDRKFKGTTVKLGSGNCNFSQLFKILKKINYKNNLILQTAKTLLNEEVKEMLDNIKYIKQYL